jgi:hypothetical protein
MEQKEPFGFESEKQFEVVQVVEFMPPIVKV